MPDLAAGPQQCQRHPRVAPNLLSGKAAAGLGEALPQATACPLCRLWVLYISRCIVSLAMWLGTTGVDPMSSFVTGLSLGIPMAKQASMADLS